MSTPFDLPPLPKAGADFAEDNEFLGATTAQDRVIETLHRDGWTLRRVFTAPNAMLPLPAVKYPEGRVYLFSDDVAVIVQKSNSRVVASLPAQAALQTLEQLTPEVLEANEWARKRLEEYRAIGELGPFKRWHRQNLFTNDGARWTAERTEAGHFVITKDGEHIAEVADDEEAEERGFEPALVELIAYIVDHP